MSVITIQVGQCGNQVGRSLFDTIFADLSSGDFLEDEYSNCLLQRFFTENDKTRKLIAKAILVDTEPKVIDELLHNNKNWSYPSSSYIRFRGGCGNLWPVGYFDFVSSISESIFDKINHQLDACDSLDAFLITMSVAGGTGSGLGSYLTESIRDWFPKSFIINQLVWPYSSGEVVIQSYNALLTLSHVLPVTDAVFNVYNDYIHDVCTKLGIPVGIKQLNNIITRHLTGILAPAFTSRGLIGRLGDLLTHLVCHPSYKLLNYCGAPNTTPITKNFMTEAWASLISSVNPRKQQLSACVADLLVLRGNDSHEVDVAPLRKNRVYAGFIPQPLRNQIWTHPRPFLNERRSVYLISNERNSFVESTKEKAWRLFSNGAYTHHLYKHGLTNDAMMDTFAYVTQLIENYNVLN